MSHNWENSSVHDCLPTNAVYAGKDSDGSLIYVGRAFHAGENLPAKVIPGKNACYVSYDGEEIFKENYDVLCGLSFTWIEFSNGEVPDDAVETGKSSSGEPLYVGRANYEDSLTPGKVHRSHGCLYFPYGGQECSTKEYEVLVSRRKVEWIKTTLASHAPFGACVIGHDVDGAPVYVGRSEQCGELIPTTVIPSKKVAHCCTGWQVYNNEVFEILCHGNISWVRAEDGEVPPNAVVGGHRGNGETLYVGRIFHEGNICVVKIAESSGGCHFAFGNSELTSNQYEVMVEN